MFAFINFIFPKLVGWIALLISSELLPLTNTNYLTFISMQCGSGRSVAPIKAGFVARVGRRNAGT